MTHDVFISYSTKDKKIADAICHIFEENNIECWIAPRNITSGNAYADEIVNAIYSAKLILLVFSSNAQNSQFVSNEINLAFSYDKRILSFNIDEKLPEGEFEYFLKTHHWLEAYPEPEKHFETLLKDASELLNINHDNFIIDTNAIINAEKGQFNKPSVKNEWKLFLFLFTPFYPIVLLYMGISAKMKELTFEGVICIIPEIMLVLLYFYGSTVYYIKQMNLILIYSLFLWIVSISYFMYIRKEYLFRKMLMEIVSDDKQLLKSLIERFDDI